MCGICGIFTFGLESQSLQRIINSMTDTLRHRGPDSHGTWFDSESVLAFGHRRLAIRDLSPTGHQPMVSSCQRFIIVYNGEVYSHNEISNELKQSGRRLKGTSDTEVILEACAEWGVKSTLERLIGMYAFALYDKQKKELYLARDRLGIKPLYWGMVEKHFIFGSELKALIKLNDWTPKLNRNALSAFMRHNYIPAPHTIYEGIYKLEPGCFLHVGMEASPTIERYWDLRRIVESGVRKPTDDSENDFINDLDYFKRLIQRHNRTLGFSIPDTIHYSKRFVLITVVFTQRHLDQTWSGAVGVDRHRVRFVPGVMHHDLAF
ncbi:hypothetical protein LCGC14_2488290 [marine sediment metagenome]|uniref:Glutamine amidotransferase type-2 domain-containing protein n=1 Tax=marine sediment metagenome TaxID=412755 RepID=A0A0F9B5K0_9ZZZZ